MTVDAVQQGATFVRSRRFHRGVLVGLLVWLGTAGLFSPSQGEEIPYRPTLIIGVVADDRLEQPAGLAVDPQGNVVVADPGTARVHHRTPDGTLLRQWGSFSTPSGTERLIAPIGVAVSSDGSVAVVDAQRQMVRVFSAQGAYTRSVGFSGTGDGGFLNPAGIARDAQDNLYVVDAGANRVQKFSPQGSFLLRLGSRGTGNGQLRGPKGVAVDRSGNLYLADSENHRIQKFDAQGQYVSQWGVLGTTDGQFNQPVGVAIDPQGNILVADTGNRRVQRFDAQGTWLATVTAQADWIAVDAAGTVYLSSREGRIERLSSQGGSLGSWGRPGNKDGELRSPVGVALTSQGAVVVADTANHRIQVFDAQGRVTRTWGARGTADGQLYAPTAVAVDVQRNIYVADAGNHRVQKFDAGGTFLGKWGQAGSNDGQFQTPIGIAVNGSFVFVLDAGNARVQKFDSTGRYLTQWGSRGTGSGQFVNPSGLAVDRGSNTYVADYASGDGATNSVQRFDLDGKLLRRWSAADLGDVNPAGVAVDDLGNFYLTDQPRVASLFPQVGRDRIVKFDLNGRLTDQLGGAGIDSGFLAAPTGLAVDQDLNIYVADTLNQRVQKFSKVLAATPTPAPPAPGPTPAPAGVPEGAPRPLTPATGTALTTLGATVAWQNPPGTAQFQLQVFPANGDGPGIDVIVGDDAQVRTAAYTIRAPVLGQGPYLMLPSMTYSWRVRTSAATGPLTASDPSWGPWGPISTFRTPVRMANDIVPVTPEDGQRIIAPTTAITWRYATPDVFYFELQVSTDPAFTTNPAMARAPVWWILVHGGVTSPLNTWYTPPLQRGTTYYWRVRPRVQGDGLPTAWSPAWSFRTSSVPVVQPILFVPNNLSADPSYLPAMNETLATLRGWYARQLGGPTFDVSPAHAVTGKQPLRFYCPSTTSDTHCVQTPGQLGPNPDDVYSVLTDLAGQGYSVNQSTTLLVFWVGGYRYGVGVSYLSGGGFAAVGDWALDGIAGKYEASAALGRCSDAPNADVICRKTAQTGTVGQHLGSAFGLRRSVDDGRPAHDPNYWLGSLMVDASSFPDVILLDSPANPEKATLLRSAFFQATAR